MLVRVALGQGVVVKACSADDGLAAVFELLAVVDCWESDGIQRNHGSSEAVVIGVVRRAGKLTIDDDGAAVRLAGRPQGWLERADRIAASSGVNVNRRGVVFVPAVGEDHLDRLVDLVASTSLEVYDALLDDR